MATVYTPSTSFYSASGNAKYCGYLTVSMTTLNSTTVRLSFTYGAGMTNGYGYAVTVTPQYKLASASSWTNIPSTSGTLTYNPGNAWVYFAKKTFTYDVTRGDTDKTYAYRVIATCPSGYNTSSGYSSVLYVTIPKVGSRTINYNANGGSGAPASQTEATGTPIIISSVEPTRTSYVFTGWNTSQGGTGTSYAAGDSYTAASSVILYAQWQLATGQPTIGGSVYRSNSNGAADPEGTCLRCDLTLDWGDGGTAGTATVAIKEQTDNEYGEAQAMTVSGTSATYQSAVGVLDKTEAYSVLIIITNAEGVSAQRVYAIAPSASILTVAADGQSIAFGVPASFSSISQVTDTDWEYLYGSANTAYWTRWRCKLGTVYVQAYYNNVAGAVTTSDVAVGPIDDGYRPDKTVAQQCGTSYFWVTSDGYVHVRGTTASSYLMCSLEYPVD